MAETRQDEKFWVSKARTAADGKRILGVMGGGSASAADLLAAESLAALAAQSGFAVLTGGGPGIMEAASRGARQKGGIAIGVLPVKAASSGYPNDFVTHPLFTGLGPFDPVTGDPGRNRINVLASDVVAAFPGATGTHAEIRLAVENGKRLILVAWTLEDLEGATRHCLSGHPAAEAASPDQAMAWIRSQD